MRVWLIEERPDDLRAALERLVGGGVPLTVLGAGPFHAGLAEELRAQQADFVLARESAWPEGQDPGELLKLGFGLLLLVEPGRGGRFLELCDSFPVALLPAEPDEAQLHLGLLNARAALRRQAHWAGELAKLQRRFDDRIVIERAKGVLVQRLGIPEEEAYKRLRVLSRRQRRPMRDIAQSLLDAECLLAPGGDFPGFGPEGASGSG